jgi:transcriptional regulator with PAS, ATPase and Fis domain
LDEIGDMPLATQAKLLRVLQNQEVQRVGALNSRKVNVRVVGATNRDLRDMIAQKLFREDLYYRLSMVEIHIPPLASRKEDLALLQRHFISRFSEEYRRTVSGLTAAAQVRLLQHDWPGNVRELENVIGHAVMMASGEWVGVSDLPRYLQNVPSVTETPASTASSAASFLETLEDHEKMLLQRALAAAGGNCSRAARNLHIGRDAFRYRIRKHNLGKPSSALAAGQ